MLPNSEHLIDDLDAIVKKMKASKAFCTEEEQEEQVYAEA